MANDIDLLTLLPYIHPGELSYQDWIGVGMALKEAGYSCSDWDEWSRNDSRYHSGECQRKWDSFNGCATPVTGGTIVQMAKEMGWRPAFADGPGYELGWDSIIGSRDGILVDTGWLEGKEVHEPENWNPVKDLTTYLETLFEASESVGYVTESWERDGKYLPSRGHCDRSAGELIELLHKGSDVTALLLILSKLVSSVVSPRIGKLLDRFGVKLSMRMEAFFMIVVFIGEGLFAGAVAAGKMDGALCVAVACVFFILSYLTDQFQMVHSLLMRQLAGDRKEEVTASLSMGVTVDHLMAVAISPLLGYFWTSVSPALVFFTAALSALIQLAVSKWMIPEKQAV